MLQKLDHQATGLAVKAERSFLKKMNGGCQVPIGGYGTILENGSVKLTGLVGTPDGKTLLKETLVGENPEQLGVKMAQLLSSQGAEDILNDVRESQSE